MSLRRRTPCPDPENYIWVETKEGSFLRRKRGTVKKAVLNMQFRQSAEHIKISSPAASRMVRQLQPYLTGLFTGRLTARITGKLAKALNETGSLNFSYLEGFEVQKEHHLDSLLLAPVSVTKSNNKLLVSIPIDRYTIKQHSRLVTDYYFELVLLYCDPTKENGLQTDCDTSKVFAIKQVNEQPCRLSLQLPNDNWIAFLKVSCMEGNEFAIAPRNYGMKVVGVG